MLQGFSGGVILSVVNQTIVFLVLGGLALAIVLVQKLVHRFESRAAGPAIRSAPTPPRGPAPRPPERKPPVAALVAAVHAFAGAAPGTLRLVGVTRVGAGSPWKAAGRTEGLGMNVSNGERLE
jgi:Na+-transporting methylmalonyl-CoA/oxaloacetate decarboxylase gamma subunit